MQSIKLTAAEMRLCAYAFERYGAVAKRVEAIRAQASELEAKGRAKILQDLGAVCEDHGLAPTQAAKAMPELNEAGEIVGLAFAEEPGGDDECPTSEPEALQPTPA